jgi:hypothetical protein
MKQQLFSDHQVFKNQYNPWRTTQWIWLFLTGVVRESSVRYSLECSYCRSHVDLLPVLLLDCWWTSIISMLLAVIYISALIHVYLLASGPTVLRCGGRLLPALLLSSQLQPARRTLGSLIRSLDRSTSIPSSSFDRCHQSAYRLWTESSDHVGQPICLFWLSSSLFIMFL